MKTCFERHLKDLLSVYGNQVKITFSVVMLNFKFVFFFSWDNGEVEKISPWDMEPIGYGEYCFHQSYSFHSLLNKSCFARF